MRKQTSLKDKDIQDPLVRKIALAYFIPRYIIGNLPRSPICQLNSPCHTWIGGKSKKYGAYFINNKLLRHIYKGGAHCLSYLLFNGPIGNNIVMHICQEELCVNPTHLMLGTHKINSKHQLMNKQAPTHPHLSHANDLTTEDVRMIRLLYFNHKYPMSILTEMYGKTSSCISNIVNYKTWKI